MDLLSEAIRTPVRQVLHKMGVLNMPIRIEHLIYPHDHSKYVQSSLRAIFSWRKKRDRYYGIRSLSAILMNWTPQYQKIEVFKSEKGVIEIMAKKSTWTPSNFINCKLEKSDKKKLEQWEAEQRKIDRDIMGDLLAEGYKLSFRFVENSDSVCVSIIGTEDTPLNEQKAMSSWSSSWYEALVMTAYKHEVVFSSEIWENEEDSGRWG